MKSSQLNVLTLIVLSLQTVCAQTEEDKLVFFEKRVRPLLSKACFRCHAADSRPVHGGLRLDSAEAIHQGGDSGTLLTPGNPDSSLLIKAIRYGGDIQMPPKGKLPKREIAVLEEWVRQGAVFPASTGQTAGTAGIDFAAGRRFWSFKKLQQHELPHTAGSTWPAQRLDHFLLAAMQKENLQPTKEPDRATLLRRLSFDLIGLPPTPHEIRTFEEDRANDAWQKQVDRLLASPHFGERWGRRWLDLARYTDRNAEWLDETGESWLYRDWVVRALNEDMPYDDFVRCQLAADMMPNARPSDIAALGFLGLSPNYWKELKLPAEIIKVIVADEWEERVDVVSRTYLGLTVACARCHDHKFDPISSEDYYALAGVFASCRIGERPTISDTEFAPVAKARAAVSQLMQQKSKLAKQKPVPNEQIQELESKINVLKQTAGYDTPMATALVEESLHVLRAGERADQGTKLEYRPEPQNLPLFIRGNPNRPGPEIPRRFLTVLSNDKTRLFRNGSGRLELADAILDDAQPLAARVIVNRIWGVYFGHGVVDTPSNFGQLGERPTHPQLLDDLALGLIRNNWSLKWLHRTIVLSSAYRQKSNAKAHPNDPDNRLLSHMPRRRLEFEQWRDAMILAAGSLDQKLGGPSVDPTTANGRRSLYLTVHRRDMSNMLLNHDFPAPVAHSPKRAQTTTALQGLFAMNGPLLLRVADQLTKRLLESDTTDAERIGRAYRLLYSRNPQDRETAIGVQFLGNATGEQRTLRWKQYTHALLAANEMLYLN